MREGIHWRGNRGRRRVQECSSDQGFVQPSGRQACGRGASALVGCLILCFLTWELSKFWTPSSISTENLPHQTPARAVVFELYRYSRRSPAHNESFSALDGPRHRRRRGPLEDSETKASTPQEGFDEEEQEEQQPFDGVGYGDDPNLEFDSSKQRKGHHHDGNCAVSMQCDEGASSSTGAVVKEWPIAGGYRKNDLQIDFLYTKIALGNRGTGRMREHLMHIDTGSTDIWINCIGSPVVGPAGLFKPRVDSYLNCKTSPTFCQSFQEHDEQANCPCDRAHQFKCLYMHEYGDDDISGGSVISADLKMHMSDGSKARQTVYIGCSNERVDRDAVGINSFNDGLLGVGPRNPGVLSQLYSLGLLLEYVLAICLEPARPRRYPNPRGRKFPTNHIGFLSVGSLYPSQAASTVWTEAFVPDLMNVEEIYKARLASVVYRDMILEFKASKIRKKDANGNDIIEEDGVPMGFDTGSDLTWFSSTLHDFIVQALEIDAKRLGFRRCHDLHSFRRCWFDPKDERKSLVQDFGTLILQFPSLQDNGATTSDLVIKPEYFLTATVQVGVGKTCFNIMEQEHFSCGHIGAEVMRGHLFLFDQNGLGRIGWSPVTSCKGLR